MSVGLSENPSESEIKLALAELVRIAVMWEWGGPETGNGKKVRKIVRLHDVTRTDRLLTGYTFVEGKKYRVVCPQRPGWVIGVATRVRNKSSKSPDLDDT